MPASKCAHLLQQIEYFGFRHGHTSILYSFLNPLVKFSRFLSSNVCKIVPPRRKNNRARCIHDEAAITTIKSILERLFEIAVLRSNTCNQDGHVAYDIPDLSELFRIRRADHDAAVAFPVPSLCSRARHAFVQFLAALDGKVLQLSRARIRGMTEHND